MTFTCEPLISSTLWLVLAVTLAAMLTWYAWHRPWGIGLVRWVSIVALMGLCGLSVLLILLNPTWLERIPPPRGKPRLVVVVDESGSMATTDMPDGRSRFQSAAEIARTCADKLTGRFDVHVATFSNTVLPANAEDLGKKLPSGSITDLAMAVSSSVESNNASGQMVLLLSDGNHNASGGTPRVLASAAFARAANTPIFTKTFGSDSTIHDLALRMNAPQQLSFVGQTVPVSAMIRRRGRAPESVVAVLLHEGREVGRQQVLVPGDSEVDLRFEVHHEIKGLYRYDIRLEPFEGEVTTVNNWGTFVLRVVDEPIRVLLVEGKPYWDSKFLARTLSSDPSIELVSVVRVAEGRYLERTLKRLRPDAGQGAARHDPKAKAIAEIPVTESWRVMTNGADVLADARALGTFQVLVLGRDAEAFLSDQAMSNVKTWVASDSGALVCYRGQPVAQVTELLDKMLPVHWTTSAESRFRMALTDRGRDMRWFEPQGLSSGDALPYLPTLSTATTTEEPKPLATVLATVSGSGGEEIPVVTFQPYGGGRVVVVEGSGMWRWAFLPPAYSDHDATYGSLWQSLLRWLVSRAGLLPGQDLALRTDQVTFGTTDMAGATLLIRKEALQGPIPNLELTGEGIDGTRIIVPTAQDEPGVYRVQFGMLAEGRYQAAIAGVSREKPGATAVFDVRQYMEEQLDVRARPDLMARIARSTGGRELKSNDPGEIADSFLEQVNKIRPEQIRRTTAWDRWWVLASVLILWTITWSVRRSSGLV